MKNILVTGGAGYVGSHIVRKLVENNNKVIVYDNLSEGHQAAVDKKAVFIKADLKDREKINAVLKKYKIDAVMHMAAYISIAESIRNPKKYFTNNVDYGINLINAMKYNKVKFIVFSSSSGVYGAKTKVSLIESMKTKPENPYAQTKLIFENILKKSDYIRSISLRSFNVAGADPSSTIGEDHRPETHLIPNVLKVALGKKKYIDVYGKYYKTNDGTTVRDYIHVSDVVDAHILALDALFNGHKTDVYNLGNEKSYSVFDIIKVAENVSGKKIPIKIKENRFGDVPIAIADSNKIKRELKWNPIFKDIKTMIKTAWNWHKEHPNGFDK